MGPSPEVAARQSLSFPPVSGDTGILTCYRLQLVWTSQPRPRLAAVLRPPWMCPPRLEVEHKRDRTAELKNFPSQSEPVLGLLKKKNNACWCRRLQETVSLLGLSLLVGSPALGPMCCVVVRPLSLVRLFVTPRTAARQASLSISNSQSLLELTSVESAMAPNRLILCRPLLPPSVFPGIRVFCLLSCRWSQKLTFLQASAHLGEKIQNSQPRFNPRHPRAP